MPQTATQIATDGIASILSSTDTATNLNVGSLARSLVDTASVEGAVLEQQIEDQTATGINNALAEALGQAPVDATGSVYQETFTLSSTASQSVTLAAGTAVTIPGSTLQWVTGQSITIAPGGNETTTVNCTSTGSITNVPANSITQLVVPISGVTVTNASSQPVVPGQDAGTTVQLQAQLANASAKLQRGTPTSMEAAAITAQITDASGNPTEIVAKSREVDGVTAGTVYLYVYNGVGTMSSALSTQVEQIEKGYVDTNGTIVEGYKPAGAQLTVSDAPQTPVTVSVAVTPAYGYTLAAVQTGVVYAIQQFFAQLDLGGSALDATAGSVSLQLLGNAITAVPGVADVTISSPSAALPAIPYVTNPTTAPTLTADTVTPSTSLSGGSYSIAYTYTNPWGETTASASATVSISSGQAIQVSALNLPIGATGVNYYMDPPGGTALTFDISGTGAQINLTAEPSSGAASPPVSNTAKIMGNAYYLNGTPTVTEA